uniref:Helicase sen1 n=1 Tax=Cacopsylla melanoneura TaxID=428564 RepID=A0A8D8WUX4_9HEMI
MAFFKISRLKYYDGQKIEEYKPKEEQSLYTGREMFMNRSLDDDTDICLVSPYASRKHAVIVHREGLDVFVKDLKSVNGTFVNGKKIEHSVWTQLKNGDVLGIGIDFKTTAEDKEKYFYKLVQVNRRCKATFNDAKTKPTCDTSSNVNNTTLCPDKKTVDNRKQTETPDSLMKTRSGNLYTNSQPELESPNETKTELKKRKPSSQDKSEQPPSKKISLDKTKSQTCKEEEANNKVNPTEKIKNGTNSERQMLSEKNSTAIKPAKLKPPVRQKSKKEPNTSPKEHNKVVNKNTIPTEQIKNSTNIESHVLSERNSKTNTNTFIKPAKLSVRQSSKKEPNAVKKEPKAKRAYTKRKCQDKTSSSGSVESQIQSLLMDNEDSNVVNGECEPMHSTQDLLSIIESQTVPDILPTNSSTDFDFKVPSCSRYSEAGGSHTVGGIEENLNKVFGEEKIETDDIECFPNSTQDLRDILMDPEDSIQDKPNHVPIHLQNNVTKKIFKSKTNSPSKKPKFNYSSEKFYDFDHTIKKEKKMSTGTKKVTPQKRMNKNSVPKSELKTQRKSKTQTQQQDTSKVKSEELRDISVIVSEVEDSQVMSQYSMNEDEIIEIVYDDDQALTKTSNNKQSEGERETTDEIEDEDIGWLKELSQSYDDSCALVINEEEDADQSTSNSFSFLKHDDNEICFDDEDNANEKQDKPQETETKSCQELQDKIKDKYATLKKTIEIIDAPAMTSKSPRRSKRSSGNKKTSIEPTSRNSVENGLIEKNKPGLSFYCRSANESPKFLRTSLKDKSRNGLDDVVLKNDVKQTKNKPNVKQVNFQSDAEQVRFDNEDTTRSVKTIQRDTIKLNTNPSVYKLQSMQSQSIRHTLSGMERHYVTNARPTLGDNIYLLSWLCSWLPQQMTMELPPPIFKGIPLEKVDHVKQDYKNIVDFYETIEPLLYHQVWNEMYLQYVKEFRRGAKHITLLRETIEHVPTRIFQNSKKRLFRIQCSIKNTISKWLQEKQILLLTFSPVSAETSPFECFAYMIAIDRHSNNTSFDLNITLDVVSEKELTLFPTRVEIHAQILTRVDMNHWKGVLLRCGNNPLSRTFLNPVNIAEPPLIRMRDLENVGTCTLGQKHVASTFLDVCLENDRKLVLVDAPAGTGKTTAIVKAIENLLLYSHPSPHHRILVFGSGVGSMDEISGQLINLRKSLASQAQKKKIKFLRLDDSQDAEVKTYTCAEFIQSDLKGFKKEALENPDVLKWRRDKISDLISKEPDKQSPYCQSLMKAMKDVDNYPEANVLSKDFHLYFFKNQKLALIDKADIMCCNLKELLNLENCNYINVNSQRKTTVCIIEDANQCTDLDLSLILQLHIDKLILIGDSTVDAILPFACLYKKNFHWNLFKRLIRAKAASHSRKQMIPVVKLNHIHRGTSTLRRNIMAVFGHSGTMEGDPKSSNVNFMDWCVIDHRLEGVVAPSASDKTIRIKSCDQEASLVVNIAIEVKNKYPHLSVVIITPFDNQKAVIARTVSNKHEEIPGIWVSSVTEFMGRQADVVIFSTKLPYALTRSVLEVAFTRARSSLIIVGNFSTHFARNPSYTGIEWAKVLEISKNTRSLRTVGHNFDLENEKQALSLILK